MATATQFDAGEVSRRTAPTPERTTVPNPTEPVPTPEPAPDERRGLPSASSASRIAHCPGSTQLEATCQPTPEAEWTVEGTDIHAAWESGEDDATGIADQLRSVEATLLGEWLAHLGTSCIPDEVIREKRLWIYDPTTMMRSSSAKPDVIFLLRAPGANSGPFSAVLHALVIDGKTGFLPVGEAASNWQMRVQAVAILNKWPEVQSVRVALARCRFGKEVSHCDYDRRALEYSAKLWDMHLWNAKQPDAPRIPGAWCKYCRASAVCPERTALALYALTAPRTTVAEAAKAWAALKGAEALSKELAVRLKALDSDALAGVGLRLVPGDMMRTVTTHDDVLLALFNKGRYIQPEALSKLAEFKVGSLKKALVPMIMDAEGLKTKREAEKRFDELAEGFTTKTQKAASLESIQ